MASLISGTNCCRLLIIYVIDVRVSRVSLGQEGSFIIRGVIPANEWSADVSTGKSVSNEVSSRLIQ